MNESKAHFWDALATPSGQQNKKDSVSESLATPNKFYRAAEFAKNAPAARAAFSSSYTAK